MPPRVYDRRGSQRHLPLGVILLVVWAGACRRQPSSAASDATPPAPPIAPTSSTTQPNLSAGLASPTADSLPDAAPTPVGSSSPDSPSARNWRLWPEIPSISDSGRAILVAGQRLEVDPQAFSVVGDCQSMPAVFFGIYDSPGRYRLGEDDAHLRQTIDFFGGSFSREAITAQNGISAASVFSPLWADPQECDSSETPLQCELRVNHPSVIFVNLGMNWPEGNVARHNELIRQVVEVAIQHGALPVLATQADTSGERSLINEGIAQAAADFDIPLWNMWRAVQHLPDHGIDQEREGGYLTVEAWDARNYSALQMLNVIRLELLQVPPSGE